MKLLCAAFGVLCLLSVATARTRLSVSRVLTRTGECDDKGKGDSCTAGDQKGICWPVKTGKECVQMPGPHCARGLRCKTIDAPHCCNVEGDKTPYRFSPPLGLCSPTPCQSTGAVLKEGTVELCGNLQSCLTSGYKCCKQSSLTPEDLPKRNGMCESSCGEGRKEDPLWSYPTVNDHGFDTCDSYTATALHAISYRAAHAEAEFLNTGSFRVLKFTSPADYHSDDPEFVKAAKKLGESFSPKDVLVAIMDGGVYSSTTSDTKTKDFLSGRVTKHFCATKELEGLIVESTNILECSKARGAKKVPDTHGTQCASIASWGSPNVKILDYQLATGSGNDIPPAHVAKVLRHAIAQGASVISASVFLPWSSSELGAVLDEFADSVLFIGTTGNDDNQEGNSVLFARNLPSSPVANLVLPGGAGVVNSKVTKKWEVYRHPKRGWGPNLVDLQVPSQCWDMYQNQASAFARLNPSNKPEESLLAQGDKPTSVLYSDSDGLRDTDTGVSFGIPMAANAAAKARVLCPKLKGALLKQLLLASVKKTSVFEGRSSTGGIFDPVDVYDKAVKSCA